jgi:hypothetical protein
MSFGAQVGERSQVELAPPALKQILNRQDHIVKLTVTRDGGPLMLEAPNAKHPWFATCLYSLYFPEPDAADATVII